MIEAEIGIMLPQAKQSLRSPKLSEARKDSSLGPSEGTWLFVNALISAFGTVKE